MGMIQRKLKGRPNLTEKVKRKTKFNIKLKKESKQELRERTAK
jgi:hypothetical protein